LDKVMGALGAGAFSATEIAETIDTTERTVNYYLQLAEWLGLCDRNSGSVSLTETGEEWVNTDADRNPQLLFDGLRRHEWVAELMEDLAALDEDQATAHIERRVRDLTGLAESTARRRAMALESLLEAAEPKG
jgi:hypothetical protein